MRVVAVPCLKDNYAYLVIEGGVAAVVDPGEAAPVRAAIAREGVTLVAVWATHHHPDHVGGAQELGVEIVGHASDRERIAGLTRAVDDGDEVALAGTGVRARIIHNPGHTLGAISYVVDGCAFTGDTLFAAGCGRVFEGTMEMMHASLQKLAALPPATAVYFGHEYTAGNLKFAAHVEPGNAAIAARAARGGAVTTPSVMSEELATNVFLRAKDAAEFGARRTAKDSFK
jgi:hydroxyacylglutathione hydrolase|nr:hydroxyacylglutathione hydrolase [Kofleriaceae bacterium]